MKVIICGAGKVGTSIARNLIDQNNDINFFKDLEGIFEFNKRPGYLDSSIDNLRSLNLQKSFENPSANIKNASSYQVVEFTTKANALDLSLIHISEPTRLLSIAYSVLGV